jgi:hypothetical protein
MGLSLGGNSSKSQSSTATNTTPTYSPAQSSLQQTLLSAFQSILPNLTSGGIGPNVQAVQTQNAANINKSYSSLGDRMNKFLAARGFGQSGEVGKAALSTELARQGALASNNSDAAKMQLDQNNSWLKAALEAAFLNPGSSSAGTQSGSQSGSNWGFSGAAAFGF